MSIDNDDREGHPREQPWRQQRRVVSSRLARWPLRREMLPRYRTLNTDGAPGLPEAVRVWAFNDDRPCAVVDSLLTVQSTHRLSSYLLHSTGYYISSAVSSTVETNMCHVHQCV